MTQGKDTARQQRNEGHRGLDLTGGMWFFTEWFRFWVTAERGEKVGLQE